MVDLPGPAPLRRVAATRQPQRNDGNAAPKAVRNATSSKDAQPLVSVASKLASEPAPLDQSRIGQLRDAITAGTFKVDPDKIARALLGKR